VAIDAGVDVLAHAPDDTRGVTKTVLKRAVAHKMALIPTLKLFSGANDIARIRAIVREFSMLGGDLMFGTDVGYIPDDEVSEELRQLQMSGFNGMAILRMLTENPAQRLARRPNQIAVGTEADLTILDGDPGIDPMAFSRVRYTIRGGRVIYRRQ
jgi:imidazolonepropionase-like amidohydrolase